jgi:hypothetical protein
MRQGIGGAFLIAGLGLTGLAIAGLAIAAAVPASAEGSRSHRAQRGDLPLAPIKDCTPFNGRWGYYGNPWCTAAEQARWDRWDARRR